MTEARPLSAEAAPPSRRSELATFLFLAFVLVPGLSVAGVGGLGLAIWIYQMIAGPPGPPG
ncbi:MAG: periplasmic nitrate reductase, NapE protein [Albimonas sp.]|uniref:periplasmic nitrate reductase, NapE protein n=1 Tax=Albimonas sp. TaxID=1872425 RepID=UPI004055EC51|tara:strand:- start:68 stop:250 length:183 start_codon:yes stop_codon:yes gene_type:complete